MKQNDLLILGAVGVGLYLLMKNKTAPAVSTHPLTNNLAYLPPSSAPVIQPTSTANNIANLATSAINLVKQIAAPAQTTAVVPNPAKQAATDNFNQQEAAVIFSNPASSFNAVSPVFATPAPFAPSYANATTVADKMQLEDYLE